MSFHVDQNGNYYETCNGLPTADTQVPQRPSENHVWVNSEWQYQQPSLATLQAEKIKSFELNYLSDIQQDVSYMGHPFQADESSQSTLSKSLAGMAGTAPPGFYWVASDNTQVPMTFAQCQGLASAMFDQGWAAFQKLQDKKGEVLSATLATIGDITWTS